MVTDRPPVEPAALARVLQVVETWTAPHAAAAVRVKGRPMAMVGRRDHRFPLASISKVIAAYTTLIAVEEGTVALDDLVGPPGCTLRHLLCHAGGLPFDGPDPIAPVGTRRIYSNTGVDLVAAHVAERSGLPFDQYVTEAVLLPLGMLATDVSGSAARDYRSTIVDLDRFVGELVQPTLLAAETWAAAVQVQFPELDGVVPGVGTFRPCPWGLGPELRGTKSPHWTGRHNSPATYGHFGGAGTFVWVDPVAGVSLSVLTDRAFGDWALQEWPSLSDTVLSTAGTPPPSIVEEG